MGPVAVAAVGLAGTFTWLMIGIAETMNAGTVALVSRFVGAGEMDRAGAVATHALGLSIVVGLVACGSIFAFAPAILAAFGVEEAVYVDGAVYLRYVMAGMVLIYLAMTLGATLNAAGNTRLPMWIGISANALNIILDPLLIYGVGPFPMLGVAGAGLATLLANVAAFALSLLAVIQGRTVVDLRTRVRFDASIIRRLMRIGLPAAVHAVTRPFTMMILMGFVASFGTAAVAAFGVGARTLSFGIIFIFGLVVATSTLVGQHLGAGSPERAAHAARTAIRLCLGVCVLIAIVYYFGAGFIMRLFSPDPDVIRVGSEYLHILALGFLFGGVYNVLTGVFKGAGDTLPVMTSGLIANWAVKVGGAYLLAFVFGLGTAGVWWAVASSFWAETIMLSVAYRSGRWMRSGGQVSRRRQPATATANS